ncbi:DUF3320 domain-containing protein [Salinibacter ruber]|uniref:DUF3320 domain-containing protein n=1 Tax=Salinibacter ruber TaxID=146919 RepID=UPI002167F685|nr:DUF3320 domain-containing protein [Salinibacter ruber]MCS4201529.1 ElaB/YqjD/DUF883 family membrane-anchored ribosome-binding protein [Salinibacter ruber]
MDLEEADQPSGSGEIPEKVQNRLEDWKKSLIDLSLRNRLLNYSPRKRSTVEIVDELPQITLRGLLQGETFVFDSKPEGSGEKGSSSSPEDSLPEDSPPEDSPPEESLPEESPSGEKPQGGEMEESVSRGDESSNGPSESTPEEDDTKEDSTEEDSTEGNGTGGEGTEEGSGSRTLETGVELTSVAGQDLPDRHVDSRLQTPYTENRLSSKLLSLYRSAKSSVEEQGINTLYVALGMLKWYEDPTSDQTRRAPILLAPAQIERETARSGFELSLGEGDTILNPALREKLRRDFKIDLPQLPELTDVGEVVADEVFEGVREAIEGFGRWTLTQDVVLGEFQFQKFLMYQELKDHREEFASDDLVRSICNVGSGSVLGELPERVDEADLDEAMSPWDTTQVLDADSSQQRAILAVKEGCNLVIEGPPGTGKSQTIANLIAEALTDGKSVLFVSEKMAALDVVQSRLEDVGLGSYCAELHSNKTSKNRFTNDIARSLDQDQPPEPEVEEDLRKLKRRTQQLREYVVALHESTEALGLSPFEGIGQLTKVENCPLVDVQFEAPLSVSRSGYDEARESLKELAVALGEVAPRKKHPLRGIGPISSGRTGQSRLRQQAEEVAGRLDQLRDSTQKLCDETGLNLPETFGRLQLTLDASSSAASSPGAEESLLRSEEWNQMPARAERLIEEGETLSSAQEEISGTLRPEALETSLDTQIQGLENYRDSGWIRYLNPKYWQFRFELKDYYVPGASPGGEAGSGGEEGLLQDLRAAKKCRESRDFIEENTELGEQLFGSRWEGIESDWQELREFADWITELRQYAIEEVLTDEAYRRTAEEKIDESRASRLREKAESQLSEARSGIEDFREKVKAEEGLEVDSAPSRSLQQVEDRLREIADGAGRLPEWTDFVGRRDRCLEGLTEDYVSAAFEEGVGPEDLEPSFRRAFFRHWVEAVFEKRPALRDFRGSVHESHIGDFRELDEKSKDAAVRRARYQLSQKRNELIKDEDLKEQVRYLNREAQKSRRVHPIRKIMERAGEAVKEIKPCFMMSPLSVSTYLPIEDTEFDLLIFDEASQITPEDAVGTFVRADQVVVVGDSKQLPPTNFFSVQAEKGGAGRFEKGKIEDLESILKEVSTAGLPSIRLKYHYRSQDESLIRFSNEEFYSDDPLYTFPSRFDDDGFLGLKFEYLSDVTYDGRGENVEEARRVVDAVEEHIRNRPHLSLGIGTFGRSQQRVIQDLIEERRRQNPALEPFFNRGGEESFFVKNLERVQGDDRDVIFISVTYGPDENGQINRNFGPITGDNGWRRLNVLTTRAKKQVRVFSSMRGEEIDTSGNISDGVIYLSRYLKYADTGEYPTTTDPRGGTVDSPFEEAVMSALEKEGYEVVPQVGESGFRIDLGIKDPSRPGEFICGVECDGASYHSAATVRERDRLRQQVLEDRGWTILRVWSTDWFTDKSVQIERLVEQIEEARRESEVPHPADPPSDFNGADDLREGQEETDAGGPSTASTGENERQREKQKPEISEIPVESYEAAQIYQNSPGDAFYEESTRAVERVLRKVVQKESPVHVEDAARRAMGKWGFSQLGSRIKGRMSEAISALESRGEVDRRGDYLWKPGMDTPPVRSRDLPDRSFDTDKIPPAEVREAVRLLLRHRAPLLEDEIPREAVRLLGFNRAGKNLKALVEGEVEQLIEEGEIVPGGFGLKLKEGEQA